MNRVELKEQKCTKLFGGFAAEDDPDKEFLDIREPRKDCVKENKRHPFSQEWEREKT